MSAISKYNGSAKKSSSQETSIDEVQNPTGIAIFRGYEERVTAKIMPMPTVELRVQTSNSEPPSQEKIEQIITDSTLPSDVKNKAAETFRNGLVMELGKGDQANTRVVVEQLDYMKSLLPDIREPLRLFIENYTGVSKTIKVITHKLLD